ncbi:MAG: VOC family protein [Bacteroidota bacterium]
MKEIILSITLLFAIGLVAFNSPDTPSMEREQNGSDMNTYISLVEIPATDISRAVDFYQAILGIEIEKMEMPGMEMGIFPYEGQLVNAVIMKAEGSEPSANGVTIYLNAGNNLQVALDKVEKHGGEIILPKTAHADESGFFALFLDSEGNKIGLNSPN